MKFFRNLVIALFVLPLLGFTPALAASPATMTPTLQLEEKIAYQKGQFGALYARCGNFDEKVVIGGTLKAWKDETFRGYEGSPQEMKQVQAAFDQAAVDVKTNPSACQDWAKQAAATWHGIVRLSEYGMPVASN